MFNPQILEDCFKLFIDVKKMCDDDFAQNDKTCLSKYRSSLPRDFQHEYPNALTLKITPECNLRCKHCFYSGEESLYSDNKLLTTEEILNLIDYFAKEVQVMAIVLTGGEPFLRKDIFLIIERIKKYNIILTIQTNATLLDEAKIIQLSKLLYKKDKIDISLDGATEEAHDKIRGKGAFKKATDAIKLLRKYGVAVQVNATLTKVSAPDFHNIPDLCDSLDIKSLSLNRFEVCNDKHKYLKLSTEELFEVNYNILKRIRLFPNIFINFKTLNIYDFLHFDQGKALLEKFIEEKKLSVINNCSLSCHNHNRVTISSDGKVVFCLMDESDNVSLGNIREKDFCEIWYNRFNTPYYSERSVNTTKCKKCKFLPLCNTGCMASAYKKYGNINSASAECPIFNNIAEVNNG